MDGQSVLKNERIGILLLKFIIPATISMAINSFYDVIDRIFVGRGVGSEAISGIALAAPLINLLSAFSLLLAVGASVLVSIKVGEKNADEAERIIGNSFSLCVLFGIVVAGVMLFFLRPILMIYSEPGAPVEYAIQFLQIILLSLVFQNIAYLMNYTLRAEGKPNMALISIVIAAVMNVLLNPVFIFGFKMGIRGSALATFISQVVSAVWTSVYYLSYNKTIKLKMKNLRLRFSIVKKIISNGLPIMLFMILVSATLAISNIVFYETGGNTGLEIIGAIGVVYTMIQMIVNGISNGVAPIIGFNYGAGDYGRVKKTVKITMIIGSTVCILSFAAIILFGEGIVALFFSDKPEIIATGATGLKYMCLGLPLIGFEMIATGYYQAIGKYKIASAINVLRQAVIIMPLLLILPRLWGLNGCFMAFPITEAIASVIIIAIILINKKNGSGLEIIMKQTESKTAT